MTFNNIFENKEFNTRLSSLKSKIANYINEEKIEINDLDIDSLILWHDSPKPRIVYSHENCPVEIRIVIDKFIREEFQ